MLQWLGFSLLHETGLNIVGFTTPWETDKEQLSPCVGGSCKNQLSPSIDV